MKARLEPNLTLLSEQPDCIKAEFFTIKDGTKGHETEFSTDTRGNATLFDRTDLPAVYIELVRTNTGNVRANHVHMSCEETLHVITGSVELYLLCEDRQHAFVRTLTAGEGVVTPAGTAHALYSLIESECLIFFDNDPREDRDRVPIISAT